MGKPTVGQLGRHTTTINQLRTQQDPQTVDDTEPPGGPRFGALLKTCRLKRGLTHKDIVELSGVSISTYNRWESGVVRNPIPKQLQAVCRVLGLSTVAATTALGYLPADTELNDSIAPDTVFDVARRVSAWLATTNGGGRDQQTLQILKVTEEAGEVASAWIGTVGQNPRKGVTHTAADVADELADVVLTALVAIAGLGFDPEQVVGDCIAKVTARIPATV